jgi:hypothetical protein
MSVASGTQAVYVAGNVVGGAGGNAGANGTGANGATGGTGIVFEAAGSNSVSITASGEVVGGTGGNGGGTATGTIAGLGGAGGTGIHGGFVSVDNQGYLAGGQGGASSSTDGEQAGNGGAALALSQTIVLGHILQVNDVENFATISGGNGGNATALTISAIGGNGGVGIQALAGNITNETGGWIGGGNGGVGSNPGVGGAGIQGGYLSVVNYGTVEGGWNGTDLTQAPAVSFTSGVNAYNFSPGAVTLGQVEAASSSDLIGLIANPGGGGVGVFNQQEVGAAGSGCAFDGFGNFRVSGGTWIVENAPHDATASAVNDWTVCGGTLQMSLPNGENAVVNNLTVSGQGMATGGGTITTNLYNVGGGTIAPGYGVGQPGLFVVNGNYTQDASSKLVVEVSPNGGFKNGVWVSGKASLDGSLQVVLDPGKYTSTECGILEAGTISGAFSSLSVTTADGVGSGKGSIVSYADQIDVVLDGVSGSLAVSAAEDAIFGYLGTEALASGIRTERGVLRRLAGLRTLGTGEVGGARGESGSPDRAEPAPEGSASISETKGTMSEDDDAAPTLRGSSNSVSSKGDDLPKDAVAPFGNELSPLNDLLGLLPNADQREGLWIKGSLASDSVSGTVGEPGLSSANAGSVLAGFDHRFKDVLVVGAALGYERVNLTLDDAETGTLELPSVSLYGGLALGPLQVDADLGYAAVTASGTRAFSALGDSATSSHTGNEMDGAVQASWPLTFKIGTFEAAAGIRYVGLSEAEFNESGAGAEDLDVAAAATDAFQPYAQVSWAKGFAVFGFPLAPEAEVGLADETSTSAGDRTVSVGGASFAVPGSAKGGLLANLGAGIAARFGTRFAVAADGSWVGGGDASDKEFSLGGRYRF